MAEKSDSAGKPAIPIKPHQADDGRINRGRNSRTQQLREAGELREIVYIAAKEAREAASKSVAGMTRDDAIAIAALVRSWTALGQSIRVLQGRPLPGSKRPPNEEPKSKKRKPANRPPPMPDAQLVASTPQGVAVGQ